MSGCVSQAQVAGCKATDRSEENMWLTFSKFCWFYQ